MTFEIFGRQFEYVIARSAYTLVDFTGTIIENITARLAEEKKRDEISGLLKLEDNQLRDMGISRDDVQTALMKPLDFNSGKYLENVRRNNKRIV